MKKITCSILSAVMILSGLPFGSANHATAADSVKPINGESLQTQPSYQKYKMSFSGDNQADANIYTAGASYSAEANSGVRKDGSFNGESDVIEWTNEGGWVEWNVDVPATGLYNMGMKYFPLKAKGRDIEMSVEIDGKSPFDEAQRLVFSRVWKDASGITRDNRGNDIRPQQTEAPMWLESDFKDTDGLYNDPYKFYLDKGKHTIRLYAVREALAIAGLHIHQSETIPVYSDVVRQYNAKGYKPSSNAMLKFQAENAALKSHSILYPMYDKSGASTEPSDPSKIRLNTIGSTSWEYQGQWITWKMDVPEDGLYNIAFKARQNIVRGMYSTRKLYIDGKVPFQEMDNVKFPYSINWYTKVLGDKNPYLFYLTKGQHELKMEVTPGDIAETLQTVQSSVLDMNTIYRRIIMITGASPDPNRSTGNSIDPYRDYKLDEKIPGLIDSFKRIRDELTNQANRISKISDGNGSEASNLNEIINQLNGFIKEPDTIPQRLDRYKNNVSSLGSWILNMRQQPLELDYFVIKSSNVNAPATRANFFSQIFFDVRAFFASFREKYNSVGNTYDGKKAITVWVSSNDIATSGISTGRDQAQIIKRMIDDIFTPQTGIQVNLSLVDSSQTLVQAALAGKGPDVAMFVPKETPVNLAMRGALADLTKFKDYGQVSSRFFKSASIPFEYEGGHYAIPETQDFYMLFYRKDILNEMGLKVPNTWDDFYSIIPTIQKNNMEIGIPPESQLMFQSLLFQRGGKFYTDDRKSTDFAKPAALEAFKEWTGFYTKYSFPIQFDFYNRFRTGEMPIGIMSYTTYNLLSVAAPELRNLWDMAPIPGTKQPDGTINRMDSSSGTGTIMLKDAKDQEAAFKFIDWWTTADIQARYGIEQESLMGPAARYNTANVEAFKKLPWSKAEAANLVSQWQYVWDIPQLPGNYYTSRNVTFAFRKVVYNNSNERETLNKYNQEINKEIARKRAEFKLN